MKLSAIGTLLPYHSHVDAASTVSALNRLIDDAGQGRPIFFDIYTEAEKREQPAKAHTGLFFYRGQPGAPFAIIAPGGGFAYVGSVHEGFPYAAEISKAGFNAFVLKYRAGQGGTVATQDLAAAIAFIFRRRGRARRDHARLLALGQFRWRPAWRHPSAAMAWRVSVALSFPSPQPS